MMKNKNRSKNTFVTAYLMAVCLLCCACGRQSGSILIDNMKEQEGFEDASSAAESGDSGEEELEEQTILIRIYVCGAVVVPGVVDIPAGSRAEDALLAAGGFAEDAARAAVNLADWVFDGQMLYFPTEEEAEEMKVQEAEAASGLVNINTAGVEALCTLPGIGESRAMDIISYRETNGAFASCEDIMNVSGIKTAVYEKIRDKITVN